MIRAGESIENSITGERVTFLKTSAETDGESVLIDTTVAGDAPISTYRNSLYSVNYHE